MSGYPRGVCFVPHVKRRPYQARVWYRGRYWSLGYFELIPEAEAMVSRVYQEIAEWEEMSLPPPTLHRQIRAREAAPPASRTPRPLSS